MKRHEIHVLLKAGLPQAEVAKVAQVSVRTVRRLALEPPVEIREDEVASQRRGIGRPSKVEPYRGFVVELLEQEPELLSLEVLRRMRQRSYTGGKSALYELVASLRAHEIRPLVRFEGLPGEFTHSIK